MVGPRGGHYRVSATGKKTAVRVRSYPAHLVKQAAAGHGLTGPAHEKHFNELHAAVAREHPAHIPGEHQRLSEYNSRKMSSYKKAGDAKMASAHAKLSMVHDDLAGRDPIAHHLGKA